MDRFLISLSMGYPSFADEVSILENEAHGEPLDKINPIISTDEIVSLQQQVLQVDVARPVQEYIIRLVQGSRTHEDVLLGISPRGAVALQKLCQGLAFLNGRSFVTPDDVKVAISPVFSHRLLTRSRTTTAAEDILTDLLNSIEIPL